MTLLSSSKFVNDKWMAGYEFMDLADFQEKQWYVCTYVCMYVCVCVCVPVCV